MSCAVYFPSAVSHLAILAKSAIFFELFGAFSVISNDLKICLPYMFTTHFVGKKRKQNKKWQADRTGFCPLPQVISVLFLEDNNLSSREG